jgi:hypothetical protein
MSGALEDQAFRLTAQLLHQTMKLAEHVSTSDSYPCDKESVRFRDKVKEYIDTLRRFNNLLENTPATEMKRDIPGCFNVLMNYHISLRKYVVQECRNGPEQTKILNETSVDRLILMSGDVQEKELIDRPLIWRAWKRVKHGILMMRRTGDDEFFKEVRIRQQEMMDLIVYLNKKY